MPDFKIKFRLARLGSLIFWISLILAVDLRTDICTGTSKKIRTERRTIIHTERRTYKCTDILTYIHTLMCTGGHIPTIIFFIINVNKS